MIEEIDSDNTVEIPIKDYFALNKRIEELEAQLARANEKELGDD